MRFIVWFLAGLVLALPSMAEAARGIPVVRGTEAHLSPVAIDAIPVDAGKPLSLCHLYEVDTIYYLGAWMTSNGYVLSEDQCQGTRYFNDPALISSAFSSGLLDGVPETPAFTIRQYAEGYTIWGIGALLMLIVLLKKILSGSSRAAPAARGSRRMQERMEVLGLPDNAVFRFIDAMLHAAKADGTAQPEEVDYIRRKAIEIAQLDYSDEHIAWAIDHTDKLKGPRDFERFGRGLSPEQARMVLRAALAVIAADGTMTRKERRFVAQLTAGLRLDLEEVHRILDAHHGPVEQPGTTAVAAE
ncbi:DUF533 domain-containing protein [Rhodobacterales bacterium HKCCE3408]|nr:DUF533 domain-containing protein [Rhodobacterales bacterium HKCCE3408]